MRYPKAEYKMVKLSLNDEWSVKNWLSKGRKSHRCVWNCGICRSVFSNLTVFNNFTHENQLACPCKKYGVRQVAKIARELIKFNEEN